jgi:hypothetical protein
MLPSPVVVVPVSPLVVVPVSVVPPSSDATPVSIGALLSFSVVPLSVPVPVFELLLEQPAEANEPEVRAMIDAVMRRRRVMGGVRTAFQNASPADLLNRKSQSDDAAG